MRKITLLLGFLFCVQSLLFSQSVNRFDKEDFKKNFSTWAIGGGVSNFIAHGDLRSIGTGTLGNFWNLGGYLYLNKMFNQGIGLEFKGTYNNISGGAQYFSTVYDILYVGPNINDNLHFEGTSIGGELTLILSLSNLYALSAKRWHFAMHVGGGYHVYDTKLYQKDVLLIDYGNSPTTDGLAGSYYLTAQLGLKYRINRLLDLELRPGIYYNNEDHLDGAISNKQDWETFFMTNVGLVVKLGSKKRYAIWDYEMTPEEIEASKPFEVKDGDKDGVIDELDKDPNTPPGVMVYASGIPIDSDMDKVPDYKDKCPLEKGLINNDGCPFLKDTDKDGIPDIEDACPEERGLEKFNGCPDNESEQLTEIVTVLRYHKNIYFSTDSNEIESAYYYTMLDEVAAIMLKNTNVSFSVSGYTDNQGTVEYNLKLSERRAREARAYLIERGVEADRITSKGYGKLNPKHSNSTPQGMQLNRRVEIKSVGAYEQKTKILRSSIKDPKKK